MKFVRFGIHQVCPGVVNSLGTPRRENGRFRYYGEPARQDDVTSPVSLRTRLATQHGRWGNRVKCRTICFYETRSLRSTGSRFFGLMYHASSPSILYNSRTTHIFSFVLKANPSDWIFNIVFVVVSLCIFLFVCACACAFALLHSLKSTTVYTHTYFAVSEKCGKCGGKRPH